MLIPPPKTPSAVEAPNPAPTFLQEIQALTTSQRRERIKLAITPLIESLPPSVVDLTLKQLAERGITPESVRATLDMARDDATANRAGSV